MHAKCRYRAGFEDDDNHVDEQLMECGRMHDGTCQEAGTEHCEFDCPLRDTGPSITRQEIIALDLQCALMELGAFGLALHYSDGIPDDPHGIQEEPRWVVYDIGGQSPAWPVGSGCTWQSAYVDAICNIAGLEDDNGGSRTEVVDEDHRALLERVHKHITSLLTGEA